MSTAVEDIAAELERQKTVEGWTEAHDDEHTHGNIADAAACYATHPDSRSTFLSEGRGLPVPTLWPWQSSWWKPTPTDRRRELVKAGALILAEIERLDRAASK